MCAVSSVDKYSSTNGAPCEWLVLSSIAAATAKNSGGGKICATTRWASSVSVRTSVGVSRSWGRLHGVGVPESYAVELKRSERFRVLDDSLGIGRSRGLLQRSSRFSCLATKFARGIPGGVCEPICRIACNFRCHRPCPSRSKDLDEVIREPVTYVSSPPNLIVSVLWEKLTRICGLFGHPM